MTPGAPPASFLQPFAPVLDRLGRESASCFGAHPVTLEPVGHEERPFSYLLRVAVNQPGSTVPASHAFVKISKKKAASAGIDIEGRVARDFETTRAVYDFMSQWPDSGVIRPLACYQDLRAIVTEETPGDTLLQRLQERAAWFPSPAAVASLERTMADIGLWLRRFQGFRHAEAQVATEGLREYVDVRLRRLASHAVITTQYRQRILDHLDALAAAIRAEDLREVAVHADFAPGNVLLAERGVVVLDLAMTSRGTFLHDIARLHLQLEMLAAKPQFRQPVIAALQSAALRGLGTGVTPAHPLFRYLLLMHRINNLGTIALRPERFPGRLLSARVARRHRRHIEEELRAGIGR
jgi:hypothetical protein